MSRHELRQSSRGGLCEGSASSSSTRHTQSLPAPFVHPGSHWQISETQGHLSWHQVSQPCHAASEPTHGTKHTPPGQTFHPHFLLTLVLTLVWGALHAVTPSQHPQRTRLIKNTTHTPQNECKALGWPPLLKPHQARRLSAFQPLLGA